MYMDFMFVIHGKQYKLSLITDFNINIFEKLINYKYIIYKKLNLLKNNTRIKLLKREIQ